MNSGVVSDVIHSEVERNVRNSKVERNDGDPEEKNVGDSRLARNGDSRWQKTEFGDSEVAREN